MISNEIEYKQNLRQQRVLEFMKMLIYGMQEYDAKTFFAQDNLLLEVDRLLADLEEVENADFTRGDIDDKPF